MYTLPRSIPSAPAFETPSDCIGEKASSQPDLLTST